MRSALAVALCAFLIVSAVPQQSDGARGEANELTRFHSPWLRRDAPSALASPHLQPVAYSTSLTQLAMLW